MQSGLPLGENVSANIFAKTQQLQQIRESRLHAGRIEDGMDMTGEDAREHTAALTYGDGELRRHGQPHRMLAGSLHYFRVHPTHWADRIQRLAAMGVNTIDTYIPWNFHERTEGSFDFDGWRDVEAFIRLIGDHGLDVLVRPSPYICAEWSNGGIPAWLSGRVRAIRTSDPEFLAAVDAWNDELIPRLAALQSVHGGPIVAFQVENEYGSFGSDRGYLEHLRDGLTARGVVELLTTADGTEADMQLKGSVSGAMPSFTFGTGVEKAQELQVGGVPLLCSELWGGWFDHWKEDHHVRSADSLMGTLGPLLDAGGSVSLYMAHGGTNFGFGAGANHFGTLLPTVTSYDSDAPVGEDGTVGAKFEAVRAAFAPFHDGELPALPPAPVFQTPQSVALTMTASLWDAAHAFPLVGLTSAAHPLTYEELGVEDGVVVYEARDAIAEGTILTIDGLHDRATVFVDGARVATLIRDGETSTAPLSENLDATITIIVESLGRVNYGPLTGERKGILQGVRLGRRYVHGWTHRALADQLPASTGAASHATDGIAEAIITIDSPADAWLALPGSGMALVWLNGFLLGRLWEVGPQVTLYAPAGLWVAGQNTLRVLDLDHQAATVEVRDRPEFGRTEEFIGS